MAKLSQWQKPQYQRAHMYHGGLNGYIMEYSPSGQTVSVHGVFKAIPATGGDTYNQNIFRAQGSGASNPRLALVIRAADHSDVASRNKLSLFSNSSTGVTIFSVLSNIVVTDNRYHSFCASWNATTGAFTFLLDMLPVDDTGWVNRVMSTGTIGTTANSTITIGMNNLDNPAACFLGEIGFLAHRSDYYVSDWTPFFYPNGQPKRLDMVGWTQWGSIAPGVFNPNGDNEANMGGQGQHRRVGNIFPRFEGRALKSTKDGVQNTGGIVLAFANPRTAKQVTYEDSFPQIMAAPAVINRTIPTIDANGFAYLTGSYATPFRVTALPAKASTVRLYQLTWRWENVAPTSLHGLTLVFNWQDSSNYWGAFANWNGSNWVIDLGQVNPSYVSRGAFTLSGVNYPAHFSLSVYDAGDNLNVFLNAYEVDVPANRSAGYVRYTVASRPLKTAVGVGVQNNTDTTTNARFRNFLVMDI